MGNAHALCKICVLSALVFLPCFPTFAEQWLIGRDYGSGDYVFDVSETQAECPSDFSGLAREHWKAAVATNNALTPAKRGPSPTPLIHPETLKASVPMPLRIASRAQWQIVGRSDRVTLEPVVAATEESEGGPCWRLATKDWSQIDLRKSQSKLVVAVSPPKPSYKWNFAAHDPQSRHEIPIKIHQEFLSRKSKSRFAIFQGQVDRAWKGDPNQPLAWDLVSYGPFEVKVAGSPYFFYSVSVSTSAQLYDASAIYNRTKKQLCHFKTGNQESHWSIQLEASIERPKIGNDLWVVRNGFYKGQSWALLEFKNLGSSCKFKTIFQTAYIGL